MFVLLATVLLVVGVAFGYWLVLPQAVHFLTNFDQNQFNIQIRAQGLLRLRHDRACSPSALVFELPIFILALVRLGVLSTKQLRNNRRLGYFIVAVIAVLLPGHRPGDDDARDDPADRCCTKCRSGSRY